MKEPIGHLARGLVDALAGVAALLLIVGGWGLLGIAPIPDAPALFWAGALAGATAYLGHQLVAHLWPHIK